MIEKPQLAKATIHVTVDSMVRDDELTFNTPKMLEKVKHLPDNAKVKITVHPAGSNEDKVLFEGSKADAVAALEHSIIPPDQIAVELRKFAQFLIDHSALKAIGIHAVFTGDNNEDGGFGFAATAEDCTMANAVALVNCGDANMDEFIVRAKLEVPGRNGTPAKGTVITPTQEQVEQLG